jgi:hypothetical protein
MDTQNELEALDLIHQLRKAHSHAFSQLYAPGKWTEAQRVSPDVQMLSRGIRFWALIIGKNDYFKAPLSGCVNDAFSMALYLLNYLGLPRDHIRLHLARLWLTPSTIFRVEMMKGSNQTTKS